MQSKPSTLAEYAYQLGRDGILYDPGDDDILIATAELAGSGVDLTSVAYHKRLAICAAFDRGLRDRIEAGDEDA